MDWPEKKNRNKTYTIRVNPRLIERMDVFAKAAGCTRSSIIRYGLEKTVELLEKKGCQATVEETPN